MYSQSVRLCPIVYLNEAREDAARVRDLVTTSDPNRVKDGFEGPSPTQRAASSIDEVGRLALFIKQSSDAPWLVDPIC